MSAAENVLKAAELLLKLGAAALGAVNSGDEKRIRRVEGILEPTLRTTLAKAEQDALDLEKVSDDG
jgi:hypothetical protein